MSNEPKLSCFVKSNSLDKLSIIRNSWTEKQCDSKLQLKNVSKQKEIVEFLVGWQQSWFPLNPPLSCSEYLSKKWDSAIVANTTVCAACLFDKILSLPLNSNYSNTVIPCICLSVLTKTIQALTAVVKAGWNRTASSYFFIFMESNKLASGGQLILREDVLEQSYITTSAPSRVIAI